MGAAEFGRHEEQYHSNGGNHRPPSYSNSYDDCEGYSGYSSGDQCEANAKSDGLFPWCNRCNCNAVECGGPHSGYSTGDQCEAKARSEGLFPWCNRCNCNAVECGGPHSRRRLARPMRLSTRRQSPSRERAQKFRSNRTPPSHTNQRHSQRPRFIVGDVVQFCLGGNWNIPGLTRYGQIDRWDESTQTYKVLPLNSQSRVDRSARP